MQKISFLVTENEQSPNQVQIIGNYWKGSESKAIILLHMMPATKESWNTFAEKINQAGFSVLAIDLRGHGESVEVKSEKLKIKSLNYKDFNDKEHQESILDIDGAFKWLIEQGIAKKNIVIGGASIGANLSLQFMTQHPEVEKGLLLSPGLDYRGIQITPLIKQLQNGQKVFLVAAEDDAHSAQAIKELSKIEIIKVETKVYPTGGHGTTLFQTHPNLIDELINWLNNEINSIPAYRPRKVDHSKMQELFNTMKSYET